MDLPATWYGRPARKERGRVYAAASPGPISPGPISWPLPLWNIEQQNLGVFGRRQLQSLTVDDFRAVTLYEIDPVEAYLSACHVHVCLPAFLDFLLNQFSDADRADIQLDILIDGQCAVAALRRRNQTQLPAGSIVDRLLLISRFQPEPAWNDPDLQEMQRLQRRRIELAVHDAGSCGHPLHVASRNDASGAEAVAVFHRAIEDVCDYLHIAVGMGSEAASGRHPIVVDHAQHRESVLLGIEIFAE